MKRLFTLIVSFLSFFAVMADEYDDYVSLYKDIAIREMMDYGIPASITLAQGILESGLGKSYVAVEGNNHFGIKCHNDWSGATLRHDDDANQECFRKYDNPEQSFIDHSQFLKNRARYSFLFELDRTDYKGWAKGLKEAGYATDPKYPTRLINLIEEHNLHQYDLMQTVTPAKQKVVKNPINGIKHVFAQRNETYYTLSVKHRVPFDLIYVYNDVDKDSKQPSEGDIVYLKPKKNKCEKCKPHIVEKGESMYIISQKYGVKLIKLYDINKMSYDSIPSVGQIIKFD
ncbi:MAG: glucosaminidase domain-containing protein [Paludibacteraceae bacterium]|nr:glucosaminidase domain-containing protein [Paludibacteraceae bacterium]